MYIVCSFRLTKFVLQCVLKRPNYIRSLDELYWQHDLAHCMVTTAYLGSRFRGAEDLNVHHLLPRTHRIEILPHAFLQLHLLPHACKYVEPVLAVDLTLGGHKPVLNQVQFRLNQKPASNSICFPGNPRCDCLRKINSAPTAPWQTAAPGFGGLIISSTRFANVCQFKH